jgi:hypothetical protein
VETIQEGISQFVSGFASLFVLSLGIWMFGLIVLLFREMFRSNELVLREYLQKVWKLLLLSFEIVAYGGVVVELFLILYSKDKVSHVFTLLDALILSVVYLSIRRQTVGFFKGKLRMGRERNQ